MKNECRNLIFLLFSTTSRGLTKKKKGRIAETFHWLFYPNLFLSPAATFRAFWSLARPAFPKEFEIY